MSDNQETENLFSLVDVTTLEGTSFLKRASLRQVLLWAKIFGMDGKLTKRLDLITDVETLQYLFWNSSDQSQPPSDYLDTLTVRCNELASNVAVDETSIEELMSRLPEEILSNVNLQKETDDTMAELKKPKDKKGTKKAAETKEPKEKKAPKEKVPVDHSTSNKAKVFAAVMKGTTEVADLVKITGGAVKESTIKSWVSGWYRGENLPAIASEEDKTILEAQGKKVAKQKEADRAAKEKAAEEEKAKKKADADAKKKADEEAAAKKGEKEE